MKIENAKTVFFKSKDEYLAFRSAWAKAVNEKKHRLNSTHHVLHLVLRGRDSSSGFTPVQNPIKLANGWTPNGAHDAAVGQLKWLAKGYDIKDFLEPFGGTVTKDMIGQLREYL